MLSCPESLLTIIPVDTEPSPEEVSHSQKHKHFSPHIYIHYILQATVPSQNLHSSLEPLALLPLKSFTPTVQLCSSSFLAVQSGECFLAICPLLSIQVWLLYFQTLSHSYSSQHCITKGQHTCLRMAEPSMVESRPRRDKPVNLLSIQGDNGPRTLIVKNCYLVTLQLHNLSLF